MDSRVRFDRSARRSGSRRIRLGLIALVVGMFAATSQAFATFAVGDRVWNDVNNNGIFDANEAGISGVSIRLYNDINADCVPDSTAALRSGTTNASGAYLFTGVGNSRYVVQLEASNFTGTGPLVGFRSSTGSNSTTSGPYEPGLNESNNAADNNKDHGRTVSITGGTVVRACHVLILGGTEPVGEGNQPPGIINPDTDPNTNNTIDLGVYKPTILGALGDRVWEDRDHDGVQDAGEPGVAKVTVNLCNSAGTSIATATTTADGSYLFSNLVAGTYSIGFPSLPTGAVLSPANAGGNEATDSDATAVAACNIAVTLAAGQSNLTVDAGIYFPSTSDYPPTSFPTNPSSPSSIQLLSVTQQGADAVTGTQTWTYLITSGVKPSISHYSFGVCAQGAPNAPLFGSNVLVSATDSPAAVITDDPSTAFVEQRAIKIDSGFGGGEARTVSFVLNGWWPIDTTSLKAVIKAGPTDFAATVPAPGCPVPQLDVQKVNAAAGNPDVAVGGTVTYRIEVRNLSRVPVAAAEVVVKDPLVTSLNLVTATPDADGKLSAGEVWVYKLPSGQDVRQTANTCDPLVNTATVQRGTGPVADSSTLTTGVICYGSIGDRVWLDQDGDGVQDAGEPGVDGASVTICNSAGVVLSTTTTAADGSYVFPQLIAGTYRVGFSALPAGSVLTIANRGTDDAVDSDATAVASCSAASAITVVLDRGENDRSVDAGVYSPLALGNLVWRDDDNDAVRDAAEPGIAGVGVELLNAAGTVVATRTTDANGLYRFDGLAPGTYSVRIPVVPAGFVSSLGGATAPDPDSDVDNEDDGAPSGAAIVSLQITLASGTEPLVAVDTDGPNGNLTLDFGLAPLASIGDRVWLDADGDGIQDAGEVGVAGVTVSLCNSAGTVIASTTTNATGGYTFAGLAPGSYKVGFTNLPAGAVLTPANQGANDAVDSDATAVATCNVPVTLVAGEQNTSVDAGVYFPLTLGNLVWRDLDNSGTFNGAEVGIAGVTVELVNAAGGVTTTTTGAGGVYSFSGLAPGDYSVRLPAVNFAAGGPLAGLQSSTGGGTEPAVDPDNNVDNADDGSAAGGAISSGVITLASGTEPTSDGDGANGNLTVDFGVFAPASIGDRVWQDQNGNGIQDAGEPGLSNVTVNLCNSAGTVIATTTTNNDGLYRFDGVSPGAYQVGFPTLPAGAVLTPANQGANDAVDSDATAVAACNVPVTVTSGQTVTSVDAGVYFPLALGNLVWRDLDNSGTFNGAEVGIPGVTVELVNAAGGVTTTTTAAGGLYSFSGLAPGDYTVRLPAANFAAGGPLAGLQSSTGNDPASDPDNNVDGDDNGTANAGAIVSAPVTLASGTEPTTDGDGTNGNLTVDFGVIAPASIGDRVWLDENGNGLQDAGEPGVAGVTVSLCNAAAPQVVVATVITDTNGLFTFNNLAAGSYLVGFTTLPAGAVLTPANQGANDAVDSDATSVGPCTIPVTLTEGQSDTSVDAGVYFPLTLGNLVWRDNDNDGLFDAGEPGISGVGVELLNAAGAVIRTTTTDANGLYTFTNLAPGTYSVRIPVVPAGVVSSTGNDPAPDPDNNVDNDDNGPAAVAGAVTSLPITLVSNGEPTADAFGNSVNNTVDFGFTPLASVGDLVWEDVNHNGIQDAGEPGLEGVQVNLCTAGPNPTLITSATTDANGRYAFTGLVPGTYQIGVPTLPTGAALTLANAGGNDAADSDVTALGVCGLPVTLAPGQNNTSVDVGVWFPLALGNLVFGDTDNDGVRDATETGIGGVALELLDATGAVVGTASTNALGEYAFPNLTAGDYSVRVTTANFAAGTPLAGSTTSTGNDPAPDPDDNVNDDDNGTTVAGSLAIQSAPITLARDTEPAGDGDGVNGNLTVDFGIVPPAGLGDRVWEDLDHDGIQDAGEPGLQGVTVTLCNAQGAVIATATSDANGAHRFTGLAPGGYSIGFSALPVGGQLTVANAGADDEADSDAVSLASATSCNIPVTLTAGGQNTTVDAGVWFPLNLGNFVFRDLNDNAVREPNEPGIANVTVQLLNAVGTVVATTTTDPQGAYGFSNLVEGDYSVQIPAAELAPTGDLAGLVSSTGGGADPDGNVDNDDNGSPTDAGDVQSLPITLSRDAEPTTDGDGANGNLTVDFGFVLPPAAAATIGDRVWLDRDRDGVQDADEVGVPDVTVTLYDAQNQPVATTTTNADGIYTFTGIAPGTYSVGFTGPAGSQFSPADQGGNDANDSDVNPAGRTATVTVGVGETNITLDAGIWFPVNVGNVVFDDIDNDGVRDAGEPGRSGVTVELVSGGAVVDTTTTATDGTYGFAGLEPGDYQVRLAASNFAAGGPLSGYVTSTGTNGSSTGPSEPAPDPDNNIDADDNGSLLGGAVVADPVTLLSGDEPAVTVDGDGTNGNLTVDFGVFRPATLGDRVWRDIDGDGVQDAGEAGIPGVLVTLFDAAGNVVDTATTDADGNYSFTGLAAGDYAVGFTAPAGMSFSPPNHGGDDALDSDADPATGRTALVSLNPGEVDNSVDAGLFVPAILGDRVWSDIDSDGFQDAGEAGVPNVTVTMYDAANTAIATDTTDADGNYLFTGLAPGSYTVEFTTFPPDAILSPQNQGADDAVDSDVDPATSRTAAVTLASGDDNRTVDAGLFVPASLGNRVWVDQNGNGVQDDGEPGAPDVRVTLFDGTTVVATDITDANGEYLFPNLAPGTYTVGFTTLPTGTALTGQNLGGNDETDSDPDPTTGRTGPITITAGQSVVTVDAGVVAPAAVGDRVWSDLDQDGIQDAGEPGVQGVTVTLRDAQGAVVDTEITDADGAYLFSGLQPGEYTVTFTTLPAGTTFSPANQGANDAVDSDADTATGSTAPVTLTSGELDATVDAGLRPPASLGDRVWRDLDGDGIQDAGEPGVPDVAVTLRDAQGATVATTTTDQDGLYRFTGLTPGTYSILFTAPAGTTLTAANVGGDDTVDSDPNSTTGVTGPITLAAGDDNTTVDAGIVEPASLGDRVWSDLNENGIQDEGEPGVPGVTVTLRDADGATVATTTTNADGNYTFTGLAPGAYTVAFTDLPVGSVFSPGDQGGDDTRDSDVVNPATGQTAPVTVPAGANVTTVDAGLLPPPASIGDRVWLDRNGNGIQDPGELGVPGVTVTLCSNGQVIATQTTGEDGAYRFDDVAPGTYQIGFTNLPAGSQPSPANVGSDDTVDSDLVTAGECTINVTVAVGQVNNTVDAGVYVPVDLGDRVWIDANNNGIVDPGEAGVPLVTVELINPVTGAVLGTTATGPDGVYRFDNLAPGEYQVRVPAANFVAGGPLAGFVSSTGANASATGPTEPAPDPDDDIDNDDNGTAGAGGLLSGPVTLISGGEPTADGDDANSNLTIDFGVFNTGSLVGDRVWNDQNQNGIQDPGEPGVANVTVTLSIGGTPVATVVTSPEGIYVFVNVLPGDYTVTFSNLPPGATASPADQGGNDALDSDPLPGSGTSVPVTVTAATENRTIDLGLILPSSIGDAVWNDGNANGLHEAGEPGVPGVLVTLYDAGGGQVAQTTTDGAGVYSFPNLAPGTYSVGFSNLPAGVQFTPANQGTDDAIDSDANPGGRTDAFVLLAGQNLLTVDAGLTGLITIAGTPQPTTLSVRKRANKGVIKVGTNVIFTITVRNTGAVAATSVKVCDLLPRGTRFVSGTRGSRVERGRRCWTIASLGAGQSRSFRLTVRATTTGVKVNVATAVASNARQVTGRAGIRVVTNPGGIRIPRVTGERP